MAKDSNTVDYDLIERCLLGEGASSTSIHRALEMVLALKNAAPQALAQMVRASGKSAEAEDTEGRGFKSRKPAEAAPSAMIPLLTELSEYLQCHADVRDSESGPVPNVAMLLMRDVDAAIERLKSAAPQAMAGREDVNQATPGSPTGNAVAAPYGPNGRIYFGMPAEYVRRYLYRWTKDGMEVDYDGEWFGLLGVIFVVLKILDVKPIGDWSWWWVTAPFWGGLALVLAVVGVLLLGGAFAWCLARMRGRG